MNGHTATPAERSRRRLAGRRRCRARAIPRAPRAQAPLAPAPPRISYASWHNAGFVAALCGWCLEKPLLLVAAAVWTGVGVADAIRRRRAERCRRERSESGLHVLL